MQFPTISWSRTRTVLYQRKYLIGGVILLLIIGGMVWKMTSSDAAPAAENSPREVVVGKVADLMNGGGALSVVAEIRSVSEAKISTESGGRVVRVRASLGDYVGAGQVLAEIENASQRAALLQAEGALDAAKASAGGSRDSAVPTLLSAYAAMNSAVEDAVGQIMTNPEGSQSGFTVSSRDTQALADLESMRPRMAQILRRQEPIATTLTESSDLTAELALTESELREVRAYLDIVLKVLNAGVVRDDVTTATISGYVADVTAARSAVTTSLSAVISTRNSLETNGSIVSSSAASVKQAEGAYNAALANLEKTIIRSPIAGTLNNFTIKLGDFLSPSQEVAIVSNNGALEAVAYVTEEDRGRVVVGQKVQLGDVSGTIAKIAPALDPVTRRIEIRISLPAKTTLTNGQSVRVELGEAQTKTAAQGPLSIPITALKIESGRTIVFGVEEGKVVAHEIKIGKLSGASVQVIEGLTAESEIIADVRGLKEGDEVAVAK